MGVTGLWTVVQPCARPIKIETLNKKRLAVDASIWIYQFLKAVRDKEGNALRNSHVVGFFRRICKLLFFGIKPVFVFDGGAPTLKRQTISGRKQRREGRREDAVRTAGKLLAVQMQRRAEEEEQKRKEAAQRPKQQEEEPLPDNLVYVDELQMTQQERQQNRKFKRTDQYHLPQLDVALSEMVGGNDPRVMSMEELEQYARQFDTGEDINVYDFSKIDYDSPFFLSLPPSDRYNILNAARLRSRLRMGHSKDQLDTLFPDRMAFSRFQIDRVKERNELTQRVMHVNGMGDDAAFGINGTSRVSGEKGREYVLVKNSGAEGGWALGVIGDRNEGQKDKPIDVDQPDRDHEDSAEDEWEDENEDFEDVPIEGLNRLPRSMKKKQKQANGALQDLTSKDVLDRRRALYEFRLKSEAVGTEPRHEEPDALFLAEDPGEEVVSNEEHFEDDDLQKAIAMSLQYGAQGTISDDEQDDDYAEVFGVNQNARSEQDRREVGFPASNKGQNSTNNAIRDASLDIEEALRESRQSAYHPHSGEDPTTTPVGDSESSQNKSNIERKISTSDGPLPFESMDLGSSLLGKKKIKRIQEESAGGFISENEKQGKKSAPIPPWFTGDLEANIQAQNDIEFEDRAKDKRADEEEMFEFQNAPKLRQQDTQEVIDVDAPETELRATIQLDSDEDEKMPAGVSETFVEDQEIRMGDIADLVRAEPPSRSSSNLDSEEPNEGQEPKSKSQRVTKSPSKEATDTQHPTLESQEVAISLSEEPLEWEESDNEQKQGPIPPATRSKSSSPEFEDVDLLAPQPNKTLPIAVDVQEHAEEDGQPPMSGTANQYMALEDEFGPQDIYSDAEEDELMRHLAAEAEEHARFASTLNNKTQRQNAEDYEQELKALRSQQKKDRRDADEVTQIMITECQQLLKLFGLPYITAPMEAEAQCAELVALGLVDGIVTDDSDIFLFGGTRVYKNMFNQAKFVECYLSSDLERDFDLTREKLIRAAHLLGSDYTEGLPGVGPVTALEIVSEFPEGLDKFKDWWNHVQTGAPPSEEDKQSPFRKKFRKNSTKLFLPAGFPDQRVDLAYLNPEVDSDPSAFQWGIPDLDALRAFLMATIGWSQERTDEVLVPVIKDMNRRENEGTQANITSFLESGGVGAGAFAPRVRSDGKSKRMEKALGNMAERARNKRKAELRTAAEDDDDHENDTDEIAAQDAVIAVPGSIAAATETRSPATTRKTKTRSKQKQMADTNGSMNEHDDDSDDFRPKKRSKMRRSRV